MPMEAARKKELDFFHNSPHYGDLKNVGTGFLANKLSNHLVNAIRKQLPVIQNKVNDSIVDLEKELESLGGPAISGRGGMVHTVLQMCRLVEETFAKVCITNHNCCLWGLWKPAVSAECITASLLQQAVAWLPVCPGLPAWLVVSYF